MAARNNAMIKREQLIRLFDKLADERLIYVRAPAGYGKTVAVRQWLDSNDRTRAVITLDEYDNNINHFCERFCAALRACQTRNATLSGIVSHPAFGGAPVEFTLRAIGALGGRKCVSLVIDDLHFISDKRVLSLLLVILKRLPRLFQIILISRNDLPDGFSELWARNRLVKVTAEDLRFSNEETMQLYQKRGCPVTPEQADDICRYTEGWAIGISALLLSGGKPSGERLQYLDEFIRRNIWEKWDESTRDFMLRTAAARELAPSLCDILSGVPDSERVLKSLVQSGAFIFQTTDGVYHYHHLFHEFLRHMLEERGNEYLYSLLEKEGMWHLARRDFYSAVDCFVKCENYEALARCFGLLVNSGHEHFHIEKMISLSHIAVIQKAADGFPYIYSVLAWAAFNEGRADDMARYADIYYMNQPVIVAMDPSLRLNEVLVRLIDFRFTLMELIEAVTKMPASTAQENIGAMGVSIGTINQNMPLLHRGTRDFSECAVGDIEANLEMMYAAFGSLFGIWAQMLSDCLAAGLLYERGQLEKAYAHALAANAGISGSASPESKFFAAVILVYALDAMGEHRQAEQVLSRIDAVIESERAYNLNRNLSAVKTRRKLGLGDINAAKDWLSEYGTAQYDTLNSYDMYSTYTTCRAYIASGDYDSAIILLKRSLELVKTFKRPLGTIEVHMLLSIAYWKKKRSFQEEALRHLESAIISAQVYGYTQIFINESAELLGMLRRLHKRAEQPGKSAELSVSFVKLLYLNALEHQGGGLTSGQSEQPAKYTEKQKTVMRLLCEGKSYREVAEAMGIRPPTLRSHIALIYKKLDVTSEADAIMKIKTLGILSEP